MLFGVTYAVLRSSVHPTILCTDSPFLFWSPAAYHCGLQGGSWEGSPGTEPGPWGRAGLPSLHGRESGGSAWWTPIMERHPNSNVIFCGTDLGNTFYVHHCSDFWLTSSALIFCVSEPILTLLQNHKLSPVTVTANSFLYRWNETDSIIGFTSFRSGLILLQVYPL